MYDYKFQIAAMAVMVILLFNFFRNKKLPLMSTRIFGVFLVCCTINLLADFATVYTINHLDAVPATVNRLCHQVFIGSINVMNYLLLLYVHILANSQKRPSVAKLGFMSIPLVFAIVMVIFAPLYYHVGGDGSYSYGPMAVTVYLSVFVYMLCIVGYLIYSKDTLSRKKKTFIICGMSIWVVIAVIQALNPTYLMSSLANMLMVILVYLSFENPREHGDMETGTLNRAAFHLMTSEMYESHKKFYMINYVLDDVDYVQEAFGYVGVAQLLFALNRQLKYSPLVTVFHSRSNMITVITRYSSVARGYMNQAKTMEIQWVSPGGIHYQPRFHVDVIECPQYSISADEAYDLIDYLNKDYIHTQRLTIVDSSIYDAYEKYNKIIELVEYAVHNDGFEVFYQPIYSNETHSFASAEALVRLKDTSTIGFVSPEVFIPIAEQKGLITELGNIVFEKVCSFISSNRLNELGVHYIEVNLSGIQGVDAKLVPTLTNYMEKYEIKPSWINLEITETASVEAGDMLINNMNRLRQYGCHFSMDDFGTGYSNLSQMAKVRFELIKLDKSLIWPCFEENNTEALIILRNCITMILQLGVGIVAEGVETKEQLEMLTQLGVTYMQGYYFSKPVPGEEYLKLL